MALVGQYTKIEQVVSKTETEIIKINYPSDLPEAHPDFDKQGNEELLEVFKSEIIETVYENAYVVIHSINSWKHIIDGVTQTMFNITYRVYHSKQNRDADYESYIVQDYSTSHCLDYLLEKNEIQQAYDIVSTLQGFEQLKND